MTPRITSLAIIAATASLIGCGGAGDKTPTVQPASSGNDQSDEVRAKITVPEPVELQEPILLSRTIGNDRRKAVFFEAFYALRQGWINPPNESGPFGGNQINGAVVGDWNFLASDTNALAYVQGRIGRGNASITTGLMADGGYAMKGGYERTGQCLFFVNLILRRALTYDLPVSWASYPTNGPSARNAQPGDVVYYRNYPSSGANHIGIVAVKNGDGMDVIDSNFVGYGSYPVKSGDASSEIIGRHWVSNDQIDRAGWRVYSGQGRWY